MKKRKLNKKAYIAIALIIIIIITIILSVKHYNYINSTYYKLLQTGYTKEEVTTILEKDINIDVALEEYNASFVKFLNSKYFMRNHFDRYLAYYKENSTIEINRIVSIVNANADKDFYTDVNTVYGDDYLILVNKYNTLESSFAPSDLVDISIQYAYDGHQIRDAVNTAYISMARAAAKEGLTLIVNSSYRSYEKQETTYNSLVSSKGKTVADQTAARPGYSEHQTGLAIDITTRLEDDEEFVDTEEFTWLKENSYKYGFILRYPEDKEDITGYAYEPWHYRYVGVDVATQIYNEGITFDEYYAYYIETSIK
ncbi:MAG: M15 family metallopeptidase [Bacilli bacterium]|nr:M15 family metallopeptidase [Bacilli bacterium]